MGVSSGAGSRLRRDWRCSSSSVAWDSSRRASGCSRRPPLRRGRGEWWQRTRWTSWIEGMDVSVRRRRRRRRRSVTTPRVPAFPAELRAAADEIGREGGTPLAVARRTGGLSASSTSRTPSSRASSALRGDAADGHPHRHGHGRQPADRRDDRARGRRRRLRGRGQAGGQDRASSARSRRGAGSWR